VASPLLKIKDAADRLGVREKTVRNWIYERKIDSVKVGGCVRISQHTVEVMISNGARPSRKR
jgi:excisionase family DNA binding protein